MKHKFNYSRFSVQLQTFDCKLKTVLNPIVNTADVPFFTQFLTTPICMYFILSINQLNVDVHVENNHVSAYFHSSKLHFHQTKSDDNC